MRYVSLFSGIEAATVVWEPLGWTPVAFAEIEPFCCKLLAERYPDVPNLGDVSKIDWSPYVGAVDLVVGGSPCQAFSVAGERRGLLDERGQLMFEYIRAVHDLCPRWLIWENVPGVLSQSDGDAFHALIWELDKCGYALAWRVVDAQFFGVAQRRRRVFVVGNSHPGRAAAVLFERESLRWDSQTSRTKREALTQKFAKRFGDADATGFSVNQGAKAGSVGAADELAPTLKTDGNSAVCLNPWDAQGIRVHTTDGASPALCRAEADVPIVMTKKIRRLTPVECERLQGFPDDYTQLGDTPDTPRYRALGNSMAVPVMHWIGERIAMVDSLDDGKPAQNPRSEATAPQIQEKTPKPL